MLMYSVVVASDRARPNVHSIADFSIPEISQVTCFRTLPQPNLFCLHEIPDVGTFPNVALCTQVEIRAYNRPRLDRSPLQNTRSSDENAIANLTIANHAVGATPAMTR